MPRTLLPAGALETLGETGSFGCNLAQLLGGPQHVTDAVLQDLAAALAALAPGLSCGAVMQVREEPGSRFAALTCGPVPFHNDHLYFHKPPHYLLLYCDRPALAGGDTLAVRGDQACRQMRPALKARLQALRVRVRMGDCCVARSLIARHPLDGSEVLHFADTVAQENTCLEVDGRPLEAGIVQELRALLGSLEARTQHWAVGDLLLLDNHRVLHARTAFTGPRLLRRVTIGPHAARRPG